MDMKSVMAFVKSSDSCVGIECDKRKHKTIRCFIFLCIVMLNNDVVGVR